MSEYDPLDFQQNSVGVMIVRVVRLKDIMKSLGCTEDFARGVVREIRGEPSADGTTAFVLPSQLAAWAYQRAGKLTAPFPSRAMLVKHATEPQEALRRAKTSATDSPSGATSLREIRSDLRRLKSVSVQPGAVAITVEQAAARLGCSRSRIFELLKSGRLKRAPRVGRSTLITLASVDAALAPTAAQGRKRRTASPAGFEVEDIPI